MKKSFRRDEVGKKQKKDWMKKKERRREEKEIRKG